MARPAKPKNVAESHDTKAEMAAREKAERMAKPKDGDPVPSQRLTAGQQELWDSILDYFNKSDILAPLDGIGLTTFVVAVDCVRKIDLMVSENPELLDSQLPNRRKAYMGDIWRGINEYCLSPQARAKIGSLAAANAKAEKDPLMEILNNA